MMNCTTLEAAHVIIDDTSLPVKMFKSKGKMFLKNRLFNLKDYYILTKC